jgi:subtilase family serine protease
VGLACATVAALVGSTPAQAAAGRTVLAGSAPSWLAKATLSEGTVPNDDGTIDFGLVLPLRNASGAESTLAAISNPWSRSYGEWLSSGQFSRDYAPAPSAVKAVKAWLVKAGFTLRETLAGGMYIEATGTQAQIEQVFDTTIATYTYDKRTVRTNTTALSLPADTPATVAGLITGVVGIDQGAELKSVADTLPGPEDGFRTGFQPCSAYYGQKIATDLPAINGSKQPYAVCGYTPKQYQSAYGESSLIAKGVDGRGVTVAITDAYASPTELADIRTYSARHQLPALKKGQYREITPAADAYEQIDACGAPGWYGEEHLDVDAVHGMAPGANIVYVAGRDCYAGLTEAWAKAIDTHVADIITNSWTFGDVASDTVPAIGAGTLALYRQFSLEAALTGITDTFASGDDGDETGPDGTSTTGPIVNFPNDLPYVTGVGGTSVGIDKWGNRTFEHGWETAYAPLTGSTWGDFTYGSGSGGGVSRLFTQPFYQKGTVPPSIATTGGTTKAMRTVPDVSMPGDPNTGMVVGETQVFPDGTYYDEYRIGGTSLSSPLFAGVMAVAGQRAGHALGFVNPLLYSLSGSSAISDIVAPRSSLYQVRVDYVNSVDASEGTTTQLEQIDVQTTTLHDTRGWDNETGVGSPGWTFFDSLPPAHR